MNVGWLIFCPVCGKRLMKSGGCKDTALPCPKCGSELMLSVSSETVNIRVVQMSPKQKKTA